METDHDSVNFYLLFHNWAYEMNYSLSKDTLLSVRSSKLKLQFKVTRVTEIKEDSSL